MKLGIHNKLTGEFGEDAACEHLKRCGYKITARNFRGKFGEIDIIAKNAEFLVFVEVKTRSSEKFGTASEAVTYYKQKKIIKTAKEYLMENPTERSIRFDVAEVYGRLTSGGFFAERLNYIENAFWEE